MTRIGVVVVSLVGLAGLGGRAVDAAADPAPPAPTKAKGCQPVVARAVSDATGHFIAPERAGAVKEARSFAYRVATERALIQLERTRMRCRRGCVAGEPEVRSGFEDSVPCRIGVLGKSKRSQAEWLAACRDSLDFQRQCDRPEVRADKPAWAECPVSVWAEKTLPCRCPR